jgi:hypothetical protein
MKINLYHKIALLLISYALIFSGSVFAGTTTIEGRVGGANCIIKKGMCPMKDDPHLALENDFVLSTADGKYYFLPNLSRSQKIGLVAKDVRVTGDLQGITLVASVIEEKRGSSYQEVWNWEKITRSLSRGN